MVTIDHLGIAVKSLASARRLYEQLKVKTPDLNRTTKQLAREIGNARWAAVADAVTSTTSAASVA